jgi:hypothetical protein
MMTIPVIPALPAGYVATAADLNALAYGCTFLLGKPIARVYDTTGSQILLATGTAVTYDTAGVDTDGMWNVSNPTRLTVQTPGYYRVRYGVNDNGITLNACAVIVTGSNNPVGAGVSSQSWGSYSIGQSSQGRASAAGILPQFLYALDYVYVLASPNASATQNTTDGGSFLSLELVSI